MLSKLLGLFLVLGFSCLSQAQAPKAPVKLIVPFAAGGTADIVARILANGLTPIVGQPVVVDNRSGASGFIAAQIVAKSAPDGQTLLVSFLNMLAISSQVPGMNLPIDPNKDLAPIANVVRVPFVLVAHPKAPFQTPKELIDYAKAHPGKLSFASSGAAGGPHLAGELFKVLANVDILHVPYRGGAPAVADIAAGNVDMIFGLLPELLGQIQAKNVKPVALLSNTPHPLAPDLALMRTVLPGYDNDYWYAISGPAGMSKEMLTYWNAAINKALQTPEVRRSLEKQALEPIGGTIDSFKATIKTDQHKWGEIVRKANIRAD